MESYKLLIALAVLPGLFLLYKIYQLDAIEHEPKGLIARLLAAGAVSTIGAILLETAFTNVLDASVAYGTVEYNLWDNFIVVALSEEACKYIMLYRLTWKNKEFNYRFDAIVYAVSVGMGFAILENVMYAFTYGLGTTIMRAFTSIPGHCVFAIAMGYFYGQMKCFDSPEHPKGGAFYRVMVLLMPVLLHGSYDFIATCEDAVASCAFLIFIILMDYVAYKKIKRFAAEDSPV